MKRLFLAMLACLVLQVGLSAQTNSDKQQEAGKKPEVLSPELLEAHKLNAEVIKLYKAGKFEEATPLAKRVLAIREKALAPGHNLIRLALVNLSELYRAREKYGEARSYQQRLLAAYEQAAPQDSAAIIGVLDRLAFLNYMDFNFDQAEKLYQRALALSEQTHGPEKIETASPLFSLAEFYRQTAEYEKAEPFYRRAIEITGKALGPGNKDVARALVRYSCLYYAMNKQDKLKEIRSQFSFLRPKDAALLNKGEVLNGRAISLPKPELARGVSGRILIGTAVIKITIDETGKVIGAEDVCDVHPALARVSVEAAYKSRYTPTLLSGVPIQVTGVIVYNFVK